ncbi:hypothetical protein FACS18949_11940 [Clostridia bacterium]|nr:hypothetical protein FACS18949_11940 [Clostridia bacterium]
MREILFRAKSCTGNWVYGYLKKQMVVDKADAWAIQTEIPENEKPMFLPQTSKQSAHTTRLYENVVDPATIGQYTDLTDRNDVRIFEGDIIESRRTGGEFLRRGVVEFVTNPKSIRCGGFIVREKDGRFGGFYQSTIWFPTDEPANLDSVIGNIHDNPEQ